MKPASPTPSNTGSPRALHRNTERGNKSTAILRGSAERRHISVPMCDHSTACNTHWHIRHRKSTIKMVHGLHLILYSIYNAATDRRCVMSHSYAPKVMKQAQVVLGVYCQPSTTLQNSTSKWAGENHESLSQEAIYLGINAKTSSRYPAFKILLWKPSEDASQKSS